MTARVDREVRERLADWKRGDGQPVPYIELHQRLLGLQLEDSYLPTLDGHISEVAKRFTQEDFALHFEDLLLDEAVLQGLFREASSTVAEYSPDASGLEETASNPLFWEKAARIWYQYQSLGNVADEAGIKEELLSISIQASFHPVLVRYSEALSPLLNQELWHRRLCPICGGRPDFAFLTRETGARWLLCSRCDAEWLFSRLECPFCDNRDQASLSYFTNDEGSYRLYICEQCRNYIKAVDLRQAKDEVLLPLERIITLDLDRQAHEAGYQPGWIVAAPAGEM
jgi:FdhE protein